jgi:hypothetical protein
MKEVRKREYFMSKAVKRRIKSEEHQKLLRRKKNKNK